MGFIEVAATKGRQYEYRKIAALNRKHGVPVEEIGPSELKRLWPLARVDDIESAFYVPDDGRVNPVDAATAFAKGAKMQGVKILEGVSAVKTTQKNGRVNAVVTDSGDTIACEYVVNAAGMWARQLAEASGVSLCNQACEHYYLITDAIPGLDLDLPVLEDPHNYAYIRPEGAGLMVGLFEGLAAPWSPHRVPKDFSFGSIPPDWERVTPFLEAAMSRVPTTLSVGMKNFFCGPESFTPDMGPIIGPVPELDGYFAACGLNSIGILSGGGVGKCVAEWIVTGYPEDDVSAVRADRFKTYQSTSAYRSPRAAESLGKVYAPHWPYSQYKSAVSSF